MLRAKKRRGLLEKHDCEHRHLLFLLIIWFLEFQFVIYGETLGIEILWSNHHSHLETTDKLLPFARFFAAVVKPMTEASSRRKGLIWLKRSNHNL